MTVEQLSVASRVGYLVLTRAGILGPVEMTHLGSDGAEPRLTWSVAGFIAPAAWRGVNRSLRVDAQFEVEAEAEACRLVSDIEVAEAARRLSDRGALAGGALAAAIMRRQRRLTFADQSARASKRFPSGVARPRGRAEARARVAGVLRQASAWRRRFISTQAAVEAAAIKRERESKLWDAKQQQFIERPRCGQCGEVLDPVVGRGRPRAWCSVRCRQAAWRIREAARARCEGCGGSLAGRAGQRYCSDRCRMRVRRAREGRR